MRASDFDLVVLGSGAGGLSAALGFLEAAAERGARPSVAIVERSARADRGGATRWSWANIMVDADGVVDRGAVERAIEAHPDANEPYFRTLEAEAAGALQWLGGHGVEVAPSEFGGFATESTYQAPAGGGAAIVEQLASAVEGYPNATVLYETEATRLSVGEDGRVDGLVVRGTDGLLRTLHAASVVVASGGFEGNAELLTSYVGERGHELTPVAPGIRHNRGEGIRMIVEAGGATSGQFSMWHGQLVDTRTDKPDAGIFGVPHGIMVNGAAERFCDEGGRTFERLNGPLAYEVWRNQGNQAYFVGDAKTWEIPGFVHFNATDVPPVEAETIAELAAQLGLDPAKLEATVAEYNAAVQDGDFDPSRLDGKRTAGLAVEKSNWARTIADAPFRAYPVKSAITFTFGGVRTDERARVVTPGGTPIAGLYAAGVVTGVWYREYAGALSTLRSVVFGRIAGREAAATLRS